MLHIFSVIVFHRSLVNWNWGPWICAFCYMYNFCDVVVFLICMVNQMGSTSVLSVCAFCYIGKLFGVVVFYRSMVNWSWYICPMYMCILLYVTHIQCSGISQISGQLNQGTWYMCILLYMKLVMLQWYSIHLWSIWRGYICHKYMCILLYVKHIWCSLIPQIYFQLEKGGPWYDVHSAIHATSVV